MKIYELLCVKTDKLELEIKTLEELLTKITITNICNKTDKLEKEINELDCLITNIACKVYPKPFESCCNKIDKINNDLKELEGIFNEMKNKINNNKITIEKILAFSLV